MLRVKVDLVAMDHVSMLTNYAHSDWLIGEGKGLCQICIHRNIVEHDIMLPYPNKCLKNNVNCHIQIKILTCRLSVTN